MKSRIESHFGLFVTYCDGTYHTSEHDTKEDALDCLSQLKLRYRILRAIMWKEVDKVTEHNVINVSSERIFVLGLN